MIVRTGLLLCLLLSHSVWAQVTAKSWVVSDEQGRILHGDNQQTSRSIASITKLMTVMVVLDANQDPNEIVENYTRQDLIQLALIKSDNRAAQVLCQHYPTGYNQCVAAMNAKAHQLGMSHTKFIEPTGLSVMNISTAEDLTKLVMASAKYPEIVSASKTKQAKIKAKNTWMLVNNTNPVIEKYNFIVSKTGYIRASGGCIVMMLDTDLGRRIVVLLGSKNTHTRIPEAELIALRH